MLRCVLCRADLPTGRQAQELSTADLFSTFVFELAITSSLHGSFWSLLTNRSFYWSYFWKVIFCWDWSTAYNKGFGAMGGRLNNFQLFYFNQFQLLGWPGSFGFTFRLKIRFFIFILGRADGTTNPTAPSPERWLSCKRNFSHYQY